MGVSDYRFDHVDGQVAGGLIFAQGASHLEAVDDAQDAIKPATGGLGVTVRAE